MAFKVKLPSPSLFASFCSLCLFIFLLFQKSNAQKATTDPSEVRALNSLFQQWNTQATGLWNISGEPCSGSAINETVFEDPANNPAIKCNCTYDNNTTCHITQLSVYALNKRGVIPEELAALTYLTILTIDQNYFTGPLPAFIANLSALEFLSVAINAFSGTIPMELGSLKELTVLSISMNNFSGTLPPELGNLVKLEQMYMDSCGVGGEIPPTFADLRNMQIMWASDVPLTGKIPDFIGNWTKLTALRFEGNSFEGPIPSSFSTLTSLEYLRISDLSNVSSSLDFIKDLKNLIDLNLRSALISGSIPSDIGEYQSLQTLDLSYNNFTGQIPSALFNMSSLIYLFLGNNNLSGTLPTQKSELLQNIDLSYNELSGSFPSWVNPNLQLNLVANNFTFDGSNISVLPGLNCLQRNFPCNRDTPLYANFSIKCGGPEIRFSDGIVYEAENSNLGPASYYMTSTGKWAVSNVELFANPTNLTDKYNIPEVLQTSRMSRGSLRYYGLGLENGPYTVSLLFSETAFQSSQTWESLGRRVFNIYIQGKLQQKDFDISQEADGVGRMVLKTFNARVSENYLEIHLFWAGKGTCCIPVQGYYGPSISALRVVSDFTPTVSGIPPATPPTVSGIPPNTPPKKSKTGLIVGITVAVGAVSFILLFAVFYMKMKRSDIDDDEELLGIGPRPNTFSYAELRTATEDFIPANKLGEGGFGPVYKGTLPDERINCSREATFGSISPRKESIYNRNCHHICSATSQPYEVVWILH